MATRPPLKPDTADSLALAVVATSDAPVMLLDGDFKVLVASASFGRAFAIDPASATGKLLFSLGEGEWDVPQLRSLLRATLSGNAEIEAYEMDLVRRDREPRRLVLRAHILNYGSAGDVRMVLAVSDVTDARLAEKLKEDLLQEKAVLLRELQHRVANSLQIIASVLLQSARRVSSEEARSHLFDAHSRVISVAALQRHLAVSELGDVALRTYFSELCASIGASMIRDDGQIALSVSVDESITAANVSVSLGLIVTELVINALKHAFPEGRNGKIAVSYVSQGPSWALAVADDGVGMLGSAGAGKSGLGTSLVEALAKRLHAIVSVVDSAPGTTVSVVHTEDGAPFPETAPV
jgi:two-component sensor histidine kinase